ncbi:MAG: hypothetical protein L0G88_17185 [Shewanella sp.]|uniref:hypothetical protein n=1 Tax=Shewanella sp. TaxID=50422 RepID=UPI0026490F24|nr:hypothetical protein [Shewanella sp.]MDN5529612.1 hypothetical protein [Shewanella sp.]
MRKSTVALGVLTALYIPSLYANVEINGFASIVAGSSLSDDKSYYGYDKEIDFNNDSKVALQFAADSVFFKLVVTIDRFKRPVCLLF